MSEDARGVSTNVVEPLWPTCVKRTIGTASPMVRKSGSQSQGCKEFKYEDIFSPSPSPSP
eukprot:762604-Hanusia_phi.AAC.6